MRWTEDADWTPALGFKTRHACADAEFLGDPVGGNDDAVAFATATHPNRAFLQFRIEGDFAACKKLSPSTCRMRLAGLMSHRPLYFASR